MSDDAGESGRASLGRAYLDDGRNVKWQAAAFVCFLFVLALARLQLMCIRSYTLNN